MSGRRPLSPGNSPPPPPGSATARLAASLGRTGVVQMDANTGTVRIAGTLDGYLTGPTRTAPAAAALGYVRTHLAALGLRTSDLRSFRLTRDYRDVAGTHHLSWTQFVQGIPVFGNGLQAAVSRTGRLLMIGGSPASGVRLARTTAHRTLGARHHAPPSPPRAPACTSSQPPARPTSRAGSCSSPATPHARPGRR